MNFKKNVDFTFSGAEPIWVEHFNKLCEIGCYHLVLSLKDGSQVPRPP